MRTYRIMSLMITLALITCLSANIDYRPRTIVAEYFPSSSEEINDKAYQGLNDVTISYNSNILLPVRFYHSSVNERYSSISIDEYIEGIGHLEKGTMIVNNRRISPLTPCIESGAPYHYLIEKEYYRPSPIEMTVTEFNKETGFVQVSVTLVSQSLTLNKAYLRIILIEDNVAESITNVARDIYESTFELHNQNETINAQTSFMIDNDWTKDNLYIAAYTLDQDREVIQAASTYQNTAPYLRAVFPQSRIDIGPAEDLYEADYFGLFYYGTEADLTINTVIDDAPGDWYLAFCDDQGSCYMGPHDFQLSDGEGAGFHSNIFTEGPGMMDYHFLITSPSFLRPFIVPARYITDDVDLLIVDGDGWNDYEKYTRSSLDGTAYSYGIWCTTMADLDDTVSFSNIVWITGDKEPALSIDETGFLRNRLNRGSSLLITGQNIGRDLVENEFYRDLDFYSSYLNANLVSSNGDSFILTGIAGNPVTDGINITLNGEDSADNQVSPSIIEVNNSSLGTEILRYNDMSTGGIKTINRQLRGSVVYLPFGFEGINDSQTRSLLLTNTLNWFETTDIEDSELLLPPRDALKLMPGYPNPFVAGSTESRANSIMISYNIPNNRANQANLSIYNIKGQLINRFDNLTVNEDSSGYLEWNGKDFNGNLAANGIYFYILSDGKEEAVRKLSIIR